MNKANLGYVEVAGVYLKNELDSIERKGPWQPIFEAFTNSLEAIKIRKRKCIYNDQGKITVTIFHKSDLVSEQTGDPDFDRIEIIDTGIGFNDEEYERFKNLRDDRKETLNKGTGRVQFIHTFDITTFQSVYEDEESATGFKKREITLSKSPIFLSNNSFIRLDSEDEAEAVEPETKVIFRGLLLVGKNKKNEEDKEKAFFNGLNAKIIRESLLEHDLAYFCNNRDNLPEIVIESYIDGKFEESVQIVSSDIPQHLKENNINIHYSKIICGKIEKTEKQEKFILKSFVMLKNELKQNEVKLISKNEVAQGIKLNHLAPNENINGQRYLFLLSGKYIDERDSDTRGNLKIFSEDEFRERNIDLFRDEEEILLEDIETRTNNTIALNFPEIRQKEKEQKDNIYKLQKMFLLNPHTVKSLKININDTDDIILRKVYESDIKIIAKRDAHIKQQIEDLEKLDTTEKDYNDKLQIQVDEFVKTVPLQNRTALTQYVARRKLALDLFGKILNKQLEIQKTNPKSIDEKLLHNLIFQQSSTNPEDSDLWLINEEFIYFKGTSEGQLGTILINDDNIIKDKLSEEEETYRLKQEGDAKQKRPDILLFPKEEKCIIIEFKSLDANISEHLNQINRYASLINNLSKDKYNFTTYYGYLIGENIDIDDIEDNDSDFKSAHSLNFIYRPYKRISGKFGKSDGSLYTEVIKYSTLLERAQQRNDIFIKKLTK